jgi:CTP:molybdopterin cytidylyltransferase MocA
MLESVQMGLAAALGQPLEQSERATGGKTVGYLICPGDCPYITPKAVRRCLAAFADRPETITVAAHLGIRGHPIILPKDVACLVASWPLTERLDSLSGRYAGRFQQVETGESGVLADVDRPKDIIE